MTPDKPYSIISKSRRTSNYVLVVITAFFCFLHLSFFEITFSNNFSFASYWPTQLTKTLKYSQLFIFSLIFCFTVKQILLGRLKLTIFDFFILVYCTYILFLTLSINFLSTIDFNTSWLSLSAYFIGRSISASRKSISVLLTFFMLSSIIHSLIGFAQYFHQILNISFESIPYITARSGGLYDKRVSAGFFSPLKASVFFAVAATISLFSLLNNPGKISFLAAATSLLALLLTGSRATILIFIALLFIYLIINYSSIRHKLRRKTFLKISMLLGLSVVIFIMVENFDFARLFLVLTLDSNTSSVTLRLIQFLKFDEMFLASPTHILFGGLGQNTIHDNSVFDAFDQLGLIWGSVFLGILICFSANMFLLSQVKRNSENLIYASLSMCVLLLVMSGFFLGGSFGMPITTVVFILIGHLQNFRHLDYGAFTEK